MLHPLSRLACASVLAVISFSAFAEEPPVRWIQSYDAGYVDAQGAYAGGSEIMHLVPHKKRLFAANGYWLDARWVIPPEGQKQSAQVLRLDRPTGKWQVDLDLGKENDYDLEYMKGNILKSVTFTKDHSGRVLNAPVNLLVMAAGANFEGGGAVSAWVRDDQEGTWRHSLVRHGSSAGGVRWVPRDMEVYRDKVTGQERIFLLLGNPGIISGVYDSSLPEKIRWDRHLEYPFLNKGKFRTRPLGIAQANGILYFSEGSSIFKRTDGARATYTELIDLERDTDTDVGGIRGLTAVPSPDGKRESLLFLWAPGERSQSEIKRLDLSADGGFQLHHEANLGQMMSERLGATVTYSLGGHNMMYPLAHPGTDELVHIIGFQGNIRGKDKLRWPHSPLYGGALYAIRHADGRYEIREVNNAYRTGKPVLVTPRTLCLSPFGDNELYFAGHDASNKISDDMAWIMRAPRKVAFGLKDAKDALSPKQVSPRMARVDDGPIYELRIYQANDGRFQHLIKRFRNHTDRIFKKHNMLPQGYWVPTEGSPIKRRRFVYVLKHNSRYAAFYSWNRFVNDKEWQAVLDIPEFQRLLSEKPTSIFMTENEYSSMVRSADVDPNGVFELRTYRATPGKLSALNQRFQKHTTALFQRHGISSVGYWTPYDAPESSRTLIYLVHHANRQQADKNWQAFQADPDWQGVATASTQDGPLLAETPERIFLKLLDFSPQPFPGSAIDKE